MTSAQSSHIGALFVLSVALFATMLGNGIVVPFLPLYAEQFGSTGLGAGILFSAHSTARTFLLPFIGKASDRYGRKTFLLGGMLFYALSALGYLYADGIVELTAVMTFQGIATAMIQPVAMAYVGDVTPTGKEGAYIGYVNTAFLGGVAGGPILGGVIKDMFNMQASFITLGLLSLLALILLWLFLPEVHDHKTNKNAIAPPLREVLAYRPILGVAWYRVGYAIASTVTWVFVPLLAAKLLTLTTAQIGTLISLNVLVSTILQAPSGRLADRTNKAVLIAIGGLVSALGMAAFPLSTSFWHLVLLNVVTGAATGLAFPAHVALAMEHARGFGMGAVMSVLLTVHSFGMMVGPLLFGFIADHLGIASTFYSAGLVGVVVTIVCYALTRATGAELEPAPAVKKEPAAAD